MLNNEVCYVILGLIALFICYRLFDRVLFPIIVEKRTKEIEKNPKWIVDKLRSEYYGFSDLDIILVEDPLGCVPRFKETKDHRIQLLISNDTLTKDVDDVARLALVGKIKLKYGLWFPDNPLHWLSILCYMLDGGDIKQEAVSWEEKNKEKQ